MRFERFDDLHPETNLHRALEAVRSIGYVVLLCADREMIDIQTASGPPGEEVAPNEARVDFLPPGLIEPDSEDTWRWHSTESLHTCRHNSALRTLRFDV